MSASIIAVLPGKEVNNGRNRDDEKERIAQRTLVLLDKRTLPGPSGLTHPGGKVEREILEALDVRFWMSRSRRSGMEPVYCSFWLRCKDGRTIAGNGQASGCGYHKCSGAFGEALRAANVILRRGDTDRIFDIQGAGWSAVEDAMRAMVGAAGYPLASVPWRILS